MPRRDFLLGVANAQSPAEIQVSQPDSRFAQFVHVNRQLAQRATKGPERDNLRANMHADPPPLYVLRAAVSQIQTACLAPIHSEFVFVTSRSDLRMAPGSHIRIDANRYRGRSRATLLLPCRFFKQDFQFRLGLNIEKQNSRASAASSRAVAERLAHFFPRFADPGENDTVAAD